MCVEQVYILTCSSSWHCPPSTFLLDLLLAGISSKTSEEKKNENTNNIMFPGSDLGRCVCDAPQK